MTQKSTHSVAIIDLIAVDDQARGRGIGRSLVSAFMQIYRDRCSLFQVGTQVANLPALRLYQSLGFSIVRSQYLLPLPRIAMKIGKLDLTERVVIVAEIGNNHEGSFDVACELVRAAAQCGVDAVKFQTFKTEYYVSQLDLDRFARLKSFELTYDQFQEISELARALGVLFISTPFDLDSAAFLEPIVDAYKIASGDNTFYPLLKQVSKTNRPVIISTGLINQAAVLKLVKHLQTHRPERPIADWLTVLHCVTSYPVPPDQANLGAIQALQESVDCVVGYSDHVMGIDSAFLSVALGARLIEKHFTLDKNYSDFRDHQISADPTEMKQLVQKIRYAETLLGSVQKTTQSCEQSLASAVRRSIVAKHDLQSGSYLTEADITWVRPSGGLAPGMENQLLGKQLSRFIKVGEKVLPSDVQ